MRTGAVRESQAEPSSFRDPAGQVIEGRDGRIFRSVAPAAVEEYRFVRKCGLVDALGVEGGLVAA